MSKNFSYEISELRKQVKMLENQAWDIKMKGNNPYALSAVGKIYRSRDVLKEAIELLERSELLSNEKTNS